MAKIVKTQIKCDVCGKRVNVIPKRSTPEGQFRLTKLHMMYRPKGYDGRLLGVNKADVNEDPHFCSKKCIKSWFNKQLDMMVKGKGNGQD